MDSDLRQNDILRVVDKRSQKERGRKRKKYNKQQNDKKDKKIIIKLDSGLRQNDILRVETIGDKLRKRKKEENEK